MKVTQFFIISVIKVFLIAVLAAGCGKNDGVVGPNNLNNQVTFQISMQNGLNGGIEFLFKPAIDMKISRIISRLPAQNFTDTISSNSNYIYSKDTTYIINEYTGVENGQLWKFDFTGSIPGQNNSNFNTSADYTVQ